MKESILLAFLFFIICFSAASQQVEQPKINHHELGIDMYPVAISIFKPDAQGWFGGLPPTRPDYNFTYRYYFKRFAVKTRFSINQNRNGETVTNVPSVTITYISITESGYDKHFNNALGLQYNFVQNKKNNAFVGVDFLQSRMGTSAGNWYQTYDSNALAVKINKTHSTSVGSTKVSGMALVFGMSFNLKSNLYFTLESSLRYTRSVTQNNYTTYSYQYYEYNSQPQSLIEYNSNTSTKTPTSSTEFIPASNFTLSYRF